MRVNEENGNSHVIPKQPGGGRGERGQGGRRGRGGKEEKKADEEKEKLGDWINSSIKDSHGRVKPRPHRLEQHNLRGSFKF